MESIDGQETAQREVRATGALVGWTAAWAATLAIARFGPELWWDGSPVISGIAVAVNVIIGAVWVWAFVRLIRALDELQRRIMLTALGITLGAGWVGGFAFVVADLAGLVDDVPIAVVFPLFLGAVFLVAFVAGKVRYR